MRDGGSTQGILIRIGPAAMLQDELGPGRIFHIAWHSNKIDRSGRSPGAASNLKGKRSAELTWNGIFRGASVHSTLVQNPEQ